VTRSADPLRRRDVPISGKSNNDQNGDNGYHEHEFFHVSASLLKLRIDDCGMRIFKSAFLFLDPQSEICNLI
jgi:hypothetical protein